MLNTSGRFFTPYPHPAVQKWRQTVGCCRNTKNRLICIRPTHGRHPTCLGTPVSQRVPRTLGDRAVLCWLPSSIRVVVPTRAMRAGGAAERRADAGSRDCHMYRSDRVPRTDPAHREEGAQVLAYDRCGGRSGGGPELREDDHGASLAQSGSVQDTTPSKHHSSSPWSPESGKYVGSSQEEVFREKHQIEAQDLLPMFDDDAGQNSPVS